MSLAQLFYAKQAFRLAMRWARQWRQQRRHVHRPRTFHLEPLEPRVLLSGSPIAPEQIELGLTKEAAISVSGEQDRYTFTIAQPGNVVVDRLASSSNSLSWALNGPRGDEFGFLDSVKPLEAGDYLLTVDGTGDATGTYSFRVLDVSNGSAIQLTLGTPVIGATLNPLTEMDLYEFTAPAGTRAFLDIQEVTGGSVSVSIVGVTGASFDLGPFELTAGGTYKVLVSGAQSTIFDTAATYSFNIQPVQDDVSSLTIGATTLGAIAHPGQQDKYSSQPLLIEQPPPADLEVQSITAGGTLKVGDAINVSWTVVNNGLNVASGVWSDSIYLSTDDMWDINDRLLGQKSFSGTLTANQTYSLALNSIMPPVAAGQYRIIVRTDIRNQVFEGVNEANNRRFSPDVVTVTVDSIQLGVPLNTTLSTGQDRLYKVTVLEGETLQVRVSTSANDAANEVYLRFNQAPTPFQFDAGPNTQLQPNTAAIIPATQPGDYYILLHGQSEPTADTAVTLLADTLPFGITDVTKDQGGDSKYVTFTINGAKFSPNAVVELVRPDIAEYVPVNIKVVDSTKIIATFDFTDAPHGLYDVKVINPDGATAILPYRYLIERFIEPDVTIGIGGPRVILGGDGGTFGIAFQSLSNLDTPYVHFQFGVAEMGRNNVVFNLPFLQTFNNLRGQPDGVREDVAWASLDSDVNAEGPLAGYNTSTGYVFDLAASGFTGLTFNVATYPGLRELVDRSWEALKERFTPSTRRCARAECWTMVPKGSIKSSPASSISTIRPRIRWLVMNLPFRSGLTSLPQPRH
jgi:hypothetical protein